MWRRKTKDKILSGGRVQDEGVRWLENASDTGKDGHHPFLGFMLSSHTNILQLHDGIVLKICCLLGCSEAVHGKLHCFRRTTHSRGGDIQVGMGMSYSITRSGNLHSNALKSAPIFLAIPPLARNCFWSKQFSPSRGVLCYEHMMDSGLYNVLQCIQLHFIVGRSVMMGDKFSAGRTAGLATGDQCCKPPVINASISHPMCWNWL